MSRSNPPTAVVIDGVPCGPAEAKISVFDRGFLYGDSVYETMRAYRRRPFGIEEHLARLAHSARLLGFELPDAPLADEVRGSLEALGREDAVVRIVVTRGAGEYGLDPALADRPARVIIARAFTPLPQTDYDRGVAIRIVEAGVGPRGLVPPGAKTGNYLPNLMALGQARRQGAHEAILVDTRGHVTEGSTSNLFVVRSGRSGRSGQLRTPPLDSGILAGITRGNVIDLARGRGLAVREEVLDPEDVRGADEVFLTSTTREVLPVRQVDERTIGSGRAGKVAQELLADYRALVATSLGLGADRS